MSDSLAVIRAVQHANDVGLWAIVVVVLICSLLVGFVISEWRNR